MLLAACQLWYFDAFFFLLDVWIIFNIGIANQSVSKLYTPIRTIFFTCHVPQTRTRTVYQRELRIVWLWDKQQEIKEEWEHKNLFTQFGLMMTYSGGESSSPLQYNDMSFLYKEILSYKNQSSNLILPKSQPLPVTKRLNPCSIQGESKQSQPLVSVAKRNSL